MFENIRKRLKRTSIGAFLLTVSLIVFVVLLYVAFSVSSNCKNEELICISLGVSGEGSKEKIVRMFGLSFIALLGIWVANRRAAAMEKTAQAQADTAQERFRDAINHLGSKSESVRQGGAHALFHLALEKESLRQSIAEILCAHILRTTKSEKYRKQYRNSPSTEIESVMHLLFEERDSDKDRTLRRFWESIAPDLSEGYFRGLALANGQFQGAFFGGAQFQNAAIPRAQFQGAYIIETQFQEAILRDAAFQGADIQNAEFQGADLQSADFQGASLGGAQFQAAVFHETQFQGVLSKAEPSLTFREQIRSRADKESDLSKIIFSGGLTQEKVDDIVSQLKGLIIEEDLTSLKEDLESHIGTPSSNEPPEGVVTGAYGKKFAKWLISEYKRTVAGGEGE